VIAAVESTDGYTGTLPQALAEFLGVPAVTFARKVEHKDGTLVVERQTETGYEVVECPLPALVTVTAGAAQPRYPTLKGIMAAKQKPLEKLALSDLGLAGDDVEPTQSVAEITPAPEREGGEVVEGEEEGAERIVGILKDAKVV
jgi:electron transfer flavoprotein beta subunit